MKIWHYGLSLATWKSGTITFLWARVETANRKSCWDHRYQRIFFPHLQLDDWMGTIAGYALGKVHPSAFMWSVSIASGKDASFKIRRHTQLRLPVRNSQLDELTLHGSHIKCMGFFLVYGSTFYLSLWMHFLWYPDCCYFLDFLMIEGWNGYFVSLCAHHFYCLLNIIMSLNSLWHQSRVEVISEQLLQ